MSLAGGSKRDRRPDYIVEPGSRVDLSAFGTEEDEADGSKQAYEQALADEAQAIDELQDRLFAEGQHALLIIFQGMDTSGKDGAIRAAFGRTGPLGVTLTSFKRPSEVELAHDFLWRVHKACPQRGTIGIFNRSHYEDVLVARVRGLTTSKIIEHRYNQINAFEDMISSSTKILKIMLHISKDEQRKRLQARLDNPHKNWKFDPGDLDDRKLWDEYMRAYEAVLSRCSTEIAPWYVVPSDKKPFRNLAVAMLIRATLEDMNPRYPKPSWSPSDFKIR